MADYPILTSPDGSTSINIGSVMLADGVDYGMAPMFANAIGGNPFADGGQLGYRFSGPRMFKFPIRLATVGALTPAGVSRALRNMAQSGAWVDLVLAGVATANAVRFDVIDGRVRESQDVKMWGGAGRRDAVVELDVQPHGYSPTWITLASSASVGFPGTLVIPGASIYGDIPGLAQITINTNLPSQQFGAQATYGFDAFYYTMGNKAPAFITPASMTTNAIGALMSASLVGDAAAPASQLQRLFIVPSTSAALINQLSAWQPLLAFDMNPSYFGRYRLHAFARVLSPSWGGAIPLSAEIISQSAGGTGLASGGLVASVGQPLTLASDGAYSPIPTGFGFFPLGDVNVPTMPQNAAAGVTGYRVKIWGNIPSSGLPTISLDIGGLWMQSLDSAQGVIARDLQLTRAWSGTSGTPAFGIDAYTRDVQAAALGIGAAATMIPAYLASQIPAFSMLDRYRGVFPQVTPSMLSIELMAAARKLQTAYRNEVLTDTPKVWWRFNEPSGASVILDWSGNGVNGFASNILLGASSLLYGEPGGATGATGVAAASSAVIPNANAARTLEVWYQPATTPGAGFQVPAVLGASEVAAAQFGFVIAASALNMSGGVPSMPYIFTPGKTYHLAAAYSGTHVQMYVNGQALGATSMFGAALTSLAKLTVGGNSVANTSPAYGGIDEVAVYNTALSSARILAHYIAGRNTQGATSPPVYHQGGYAGVSVRYQPRFAFSKEI